jgi:hypothetical protein
MDSEAHILRENTETSGLVKAARAAAATLAEHDIPHLVIGGLAVQEHGYPRLTLDVDLVVPDVLKAVEWLTADLAGTFKRDSKVEDRVTHSATRVAIDLLPAGRVVKRGCLVPFPAPGKVTGQLQIVPLASLISLKLDSATNSPLRRLRDKTDVVELITRRNLARDLGVAEPVRQAYLELWDGLKAEPN